MSVLDELGLDWETARQLLQELAAVGESLTADCQLQTQTLTQSVEETQARGAATLGQLRQLEAEAQASLGRLNESQREAEAAAARALSQMGSDGERLAGRLTGLGEPTHELLATTRRVVGGLPQELEPSLEQAQQQVGAVHEQAGALRSLHGQAQLQIQRHGQDVSQAAQSWSATAAESLDAVQTMQQGWLQQQQSWARASLASQAAWLRDQYQPAQEADWTKQLQALDQLPLEHAQKVAQLSAQGREAATQALTPLLQRTTEWAQEYDQPQQQLTAGLERAQVKHQQLERWAGEAAQQSQAVSGLLSQVEDFARVLDPVRWSLA